MALFLFVMEFQIIFWRVVKWQVFQKYGFLLVIIVYNILYNVYNTYVFSMN